MMHKTRWISFWVTLAYWLGNAWGCANTANQDPIQVLLEKAGHERQVAQGNASNEPTRQTAPLSETRQPPTKGHTTASPNSETVPSLRGLNRSKWPRIVVGPADGSTPHSALLFRDLPADLGASQDVQPHYAELDLEVVRLPAEDFSRVNENATASQSQLLEALGNAQAQNWSAQNGSHLILQPLKVSLDLLTAPLHSIDGSNPPDAATGLIWAPAHLVLDVFQLGAKAVTDPFQPELPEDEYEGIFVPHRIPNNNPTDSTNDPPQNVSADTPDNAPIDTPQNTPQQGDPPAPTK